jgi:hypothetical protein
LAIAGDELHPRDQPLLYTERFAFPDGKARLYPVAWTHPVDKPDAEYGPAHPADNAWITLQQSLRMKRLWKDLQ